MTLSQRQVYVRRALHARSALAHASARLRARPLTWHLRSQSRHTFSTSHPQLRHQLQHKLQRLRYPHHRHRQRRVCAHSRHAIGVGSRPHLRHAAFWARQQRRFKSCSPSLSCSIALMPRALLGLRKWCQNLPRQSTLAAFLRMPHAKKLLRARPKVSAIQNARTLLLLRTARLSVTSFPIGKPAPFTGCHTRTEYATRRLRELPKRRYGL